MSLDRSLKSSAGLKGNRSVLSRAERIALLTDEGKFDPTANSPLGLPKVRVRHSKAGTKAKKAEGAEGAEGTEAAAAAAPAAKGAAPAKAAAPAKGKK